MLRINPISTSVLKKSVAGALLIGSSILACNPASKAKVDIPQSKEIVSKEGAEALKSNALRCDIPLISDKDILEYDSSGHLVKECRYDEKGNPYSLYSYTYNSDGSAKEDIKYRADGSIEYTNTYYYSENGHTEVAIFSDSGKWVREYDKDDYVTKAVLYNPDGSVDNEYIYTNKPDGMRVETIYDGKGNVLQVSEY